MEALNKAKMMLKEGYTCVLCGENKTCTATGRGISPVLHFLDSGEDFSAFCAADKVVGKATAFLYVLLKIRAVYAPVMSTAALEVLNAHHIRNAVQRSAVVKENQPDQQDGRGWSQVGQQ